MIFKPYELTVHDISRYVSFGLQYIDDPRHEAIEYDITIEHDADYYSHSCDFGNAVIIITMKRKASSGMESDSSVKQDEYHHLVKLNQDNRSPSQTVSNPFLPAGVTIQDDNQNPFLNY